MECRRSLQGWTDVPLSDRGRQQARTLGLHLAEVEFEGVWSSDLSRAVETAMIVARQPDSDARLRELDFGSLEGSRWDALDDAARAELVAFDDFVAPGGESMRQLKTRVLEFVNDLEPGRHLVVSHGGVIRMLARECGGDGFPQHGDVVRLDWSNKRRIE